MGHVEKYPGDGFLSLIIADTHRGVNIEQEAHWLSAGCKKAQRDNADTPC